MYTKTAALALFLTTLAPTAVLAINLKQFTTENDCTGDFRQCTNLPEGWCCTFGVDQGGLRSGSCEGEGCDGGVVHALRGTIDNEDGCGDLRIMKNGSPDDSCASIPTEQEMAIGHSWYPASLSSMRLRARKSRDEECIPVKPDLYHVEGRYFKVDKQTTKEQVEALGELMIRPVVMMDVEGPGIEGEGGPVKIPLDVPDMLKGLEIVGFDAEKYTKEFKRE